MPFQIIKNDITKMHADTIVNPTNTDLFESASQEEALKSCYINSLNLAKRQGLTTIAVPLISSDAYGFPKEKFLNIAVQTIREFLLSNEMMIYLVVYDKKSYQLTPNLYASIEAYIDDHYIHDYIPSSSRILLEESRSIWPEESLSEMRCKESLEPSKKKKRSLDQVIHNLDESFSEMLLRVIDERGLKDPEVYKKANVTKQTFSKIRNNKAYNPTKQTVLAFAIALELSLDEAKDLLMKAGYALSNSNRFDVILSYFFENENYDIYEINAVLFEYEENLLGL